MRFLFGPLPLSIFLASMLLSAVPCKGDFGPRHEIRPARYAELAYWGQTSSDARCYVHNNNPTKCHVAVTDVTVVLPYALITWAAGDTGGQSLLRRDKGRWHRIFHGGGVMRAADLTAEGVPTLEASLLVKHNRQSRGARTL